MNRSSIIALIIFAAVLAYFLSFGSESTRKLQAGFYKVLSPFLSSGSGIQKQITSVRSGLQTLEELERDNASLKVENRSLKATNQALRDVEHEVNRLRRALDYRERSIFRLVPAEILTRDSSTWWRTDSMSTVTFGSKRSFSGPSRSSSDSVHLTMWCSSRLSSTMSSLSGTSVRAAGYNTCSSIAAWTANSSMIFSTTSARIVSLVTPLLDLNFLTKQANLQPGMKAVTSGVGGVFPVGLLVGTVQSFRARELDGQARLTPAVDLSHLEDVFVVTGRK